MSIDSLSLRHAFGYFATGVAVITARPAGGQPFGITINSLASLSLDPPLLLWNLRTDSKIYDLWQDVAAFDVNILAAGQEEICRRFGTAECNAIEPDECADGPSGIPRLGGCIAHFDCSVEASYPGGDHIIIVGRVQSTDLDPDGRPLVVFGGRLLELSRTISELRD